MNASIKGFGSQFENSSSRFVSDGIKCVHRCAVFRFSAEQKSNGYIKVMILIVFIKK